MIIVSDTTPISELAKVDHLDLLPKLFGKVVIPQGVFDELQVGEHFLNSLGDFEFDLDYA